jgi:hypothetical protein
MDSWREQPISHPIRLGQIDHRISDVSLSRNGLLGSQRPRFRAVCRQLGKLVVDVKSPLHSLTGCEWYRLISSRSANVQQLFERPNHHSFAEFILRHPPSPFRNIKSYPAVCGFWGAGQLERGGAEGTSSSSLREVCRFRQSHACSRPFNLRNAKPICPQAGKLQQP